MILHLAEVIQDEMRERGWDLDRLVMEMGPHYSAEEWGICKLSWELFLEVQEPNILLGEVMAQQLADAFGVSPEFFINLHEEWRRKVQG